ncbi:MAG: SLOG family protein [[Mycobacterium] stephanolepidis]
MIVAFTGHRPNKLGGYGPSPTQDLICDRLRLLLMRLKDSCASVVAISGMALGVDQWAAEIALDLKIPLIAAVPFAGQEKAWPSASQTIWDSLMRRASRIEIVSEGGYAKHKMQLRNEWMVDNCDMLIAVWDGTRGGTANCVAYAERVGRVTCFVDPRTGAMRTADRSPRTDR